MNRKQRRAARKQLGATQLPRLTPDQIAKLRSQGIIIAYPVHATTLVRQMFGVYTDQLAADIAAMALSRAILEGWHRL
jgi:hypothetical protein